MNRAEFFALVSDRPTAELVRIQLAYWLAKNAHRPFMRDDGVRYFEHPRAVAISLVTHGFKETDFIIAGFLHDVVEDTNTPCAVIVDLFGPEMWRFTERLSKYVPIFDPVTGQTIGRYKKTADEYYRAISEGPDLVKIVKCADRLNNLQTCEVWETARKERYAKETREYVLPLARTLHLPYEKELEEMLAEMSQGQ